MTTHEALAKLWAQYNGQRGTAKQIAPIMRQLTIVDLERMLTERNVDIEASLNNFALIDYRKA